MKKYEILQEVPSCNGMYILDQDWSGEPADFDARWAQYLNETLEAATDGHAWLDAKTNRVWVEVKDGQMSPAGIRGFGTWYEEFFPEGSTDMPQGHWDNLPHWDKLVEILAETQTEDD